ncbi:MAG: glycoside hydrolase family 127 protein [Rhodoglobus sp.]
MPTTSLTRTKQRMLAPAPQDVTWTSGFWAQRWESLLSGSIPSQRRALADPTNATFLGNFAHAANLVPGKGPRGVEWSDGDCYKYLEALILIYARTRDESLMAEVEEHITMIGRAQESDGYISTFVQLSPHIERWTNTHNHEDYNMGHLLTVAATHFSVTGRRSFLDIAVRNADYLYRTFAHRPPELGHFGWNPSNIMGLVDLYRVTDDKRYLELAGIFVDMRGSQPGGTDQNQDNVPLRRETQAVGHAVTGPYLWAGAIDFASESDDPELVEAVLRIWDSATNRRMYITGGIGSHHFTGSTRQQLVWEAFGLDYDLPNSTAYNETCANLALAMLGQRLASILHDPKFTSVVERVIYNAGLSGVSLDGGTFCYTNPLRWHGAEQELLSQDALERWSTFTCYCCPVQVSRFLARIHEMFYGIGDSELWIHQFGANTLDTALSDGRRIKLTQSTDFPWDGAVQITVDDAPAGEFAISVRVPDWAEGARLSLNGSPIDQPVETGSYVRVEREWAAGDTLLLEMPLEARIMASHPRVEATRNQLAVQRGPVVYALESVDLPQGVDIADVHLPVDAVFEPRHSESVAGATELTGVLINRRSAGSDELYGRVTPTDDETFSATLIPYYSWGNRGISEMTVWMPAT